MVYTLNPSRDMLYQFASYLYNEDFINKETKSSSINLSASLLGTGGGFGFSSDKEDRFFDIGVEITKMLETISSQNRKILICVDEVSKTHDMVLFSLEFASWMIQGFPVYFVCTGLYENVLELGNVKNLTFFRRGKTISTLPLNYIKMAEIYKSKLMLDSDTAKQMASVTKGYAYAFQVLGYLYWKNNIDRKGSGELSELMTQYDEYLEEYVYEKIWMELSAKEREILAQIPPDGEIQVSQLREKLDMSSNMMSVYRDRLKKQGILDTSKYGWLSFALPRFGNIIQYWV